MRRPAGAVPAALAALVLAGCADPAGNGGGAPQSPGGTETATAVAGGQQLTVVAGPANRFQQTDLHARPGRISILFRSTGGEAHDLTFSDGPRSSTGEIHDSSTTLTVTITQPGTYHFLCTVHPRMVGTLTVG